MKIKDYRNTEYCPTLENIEAKKKILEEKIREAHPKQRIMYNKVYMRNTVFNKEFCKIYNCKCAYCGTSMDILPLNNFEVDHFIAESLFDDNEEAGKIENLVLACYQCNRNKGKYKIDGEYIEKLNTDNGEIANIFFRDDKYYIRIKDDYIEDETINEFYNQLKLDNQTRRLDYLLINMRGLHKKLGDTVESGKLADAILTLKEIRNRL